MQLKTEARQKSRHIAARNWALQLTPLREITHNHRFVCAILSLSWTQYNEWVRRKPKSQQPSSMCFWCTGAGGGTDSWLDGVPIFVVLSLSLTLPEFTYQRAVIPRVPTCICTGLNRQIQTIHSSYIIIQSRSYSILYLLNGRVHANTWDIYTKPKRVFKHNLHAQRPIPLNICIRL